MILWPITGGILGCIVGSFLAVVFLRWPQGLAVTTGRSRCDSCTKSLRWYELAPIVSFIAQRGRCRTCAGPIPREHIALELLGGLIGYASFNIFEPTDAAVAAAFGWALLILGALDARHFWLPERITYPLGLGGLLVALLMPWGDPVSAMIGIVAGFASLRLVAFLYCAIRGRDGLGGGDATLLAAIGAWVGWSGLPPVMLAAAALALLAVGLSSARGAPWRRETPLPFGAFLALGAWIVFVVQNDPFTWI